MQNFTKTSLFKYLQCYLFLAIVISSQPAIAQDFRLLKDINNSTSSKPSNIYNSPDGRLVSGFAILNNIAYFNATDSGKNKLWRSDGTANGTYVFENASASSITRCGDKIYYVSDSAGYKVLKVTDGITPGPSIVKKFESSEYPTILVDIHDTLYFTLFSFTNTGQTEIWKSAGTRESTGLIRLFNGYMNNISGIADVKGAAFFINNVFNTSDSLAGVWKSDGTVSGTKKVFSGTHFGLGVTPYAYNGKYFYAASAFYDYLYVTDGTQSGTVQLTEIYYPHNFISLNGITYFSGRDDLHGEELWRTDGTKAGTYILKDIQPGRDSSSPEALTIVGNSIYFHAKGANGNGNIWKIDGATQSVELVKDFGTDKLIAPYGFANMNDTLFFIAYSETTGAELWKSDGSEGGTLLVKDIWPGQSNSYPDYLTSLNNKLLFAADDGLHGKEVWSSGGTATNTVMLKDINTGYTSGSINRFQISKLKSKIFFTANSPVNDVLKEFTSLWSSDGTEVNTKNITGIGTNVKVSLIGNNHFATENRIYFTALDNHYNMQLWYTDNNVTNFVTNISQEGGANFIGDAFELNGADLPGPFCSSDSITYYFTLNNLWKIDERNNIVSLVSNVPRGSFFKIANQLLIASGTNLYRKDGSTNGINKISIATLSPDAFGTDQVAYTNDKGYFLSNSNLWKTDGTDTGTTFLHKVKPVFKQNRNKLFASINKTLFFAGDDGATGQEVWKTDGTPAGTQLVKDINPGSSVGLLGYFCTVNNHIFFLANDGVHGTELWTSDGTDTGTVMVKDINTGITSSGISSLTKLGDKLAFVVYDNSSNRYVLWQSDGTEAGTFPADEPNLKNITITNNEPAIDEFNGELYISGSTTQYGSEIWVGSFASVLPFSLVDFTAVLNQDKVELNWATVNEINTKSIIVQRGTDGNQFKDIATIDAKGGAINNYSYIDPVSTFSGKLFYRLHVLDRDGKESYSKTIEINLPNNRPAVYVKENPVKTTLTIVVNNINNNKAAQITIVNSSGVIYIAEKVMLTAGVNNIKYNIAGWARGLFVLKIRLEDGFEKIISILK